MTSGRGRQAAAENQLHLALDSIEEAGRLVDQAAQVLSRVEGMIPEWRNLGSISGRLTWAWFAVCAGANRLRRKGCLELRHRK